MDWPARQESEHTENYSHNVPLELKPKDKVMTEAFKGHMEEWVKARQSWDIENAGNIIAAMNREMIVAAKEITTKQQAGKAGRLLHGKARRKKKWFRDGFSPQLRILQMTENFFVAIHNEIKNTAKWWTRWSYRSRLYNRLYNRLRNGKGE